MPRRTIGPDHPEPDPFYCCPGLAVLQETTELHFKTLTIELNQRFGFQERAVEQALESAKEAVTKAECATEKRFDSVNEFRASLADQTATFMPRVESEARHAAHEKELGALENRLSKMEGTGVGKNLSWGYIVGAVAALAGVVTVTVVILDLILKP